MDPILKIVDVVFAYGAMEVIYRISIDVREKEIVGIIGPNGAGKSTLIKLMSGILSPQGGEVIFSGQPLSEMRSRERARSIALVPQESRIPFSFSAMEVALMGRTPHLPAFGFESSRDVEIARAAMEKTDCLSFAGRDINAISGGERQRVLLARAISQEARLLLLDEPTTFLDIRHQIELHKLLKGLNRERSLTIVAAMHDLNMAAAFCDRIIMIKAGKIVGDGTPTDVITSKAIQSAFEVDVRVSIDSVTGLPYCLPC